MEEMANSSSSPKFDSGKIESIRQSNNSLSSVDLAVSVKDARFSYGRSNETAVLQETNLRIPKSAIYVLLGPSGCGKTTLLKALSNLIKLDDGEILVFGKKPGSKESKVPGSDLGYMPQEVALYGQLTVEEVILLFGKLHSVKKTTIYERLDNLVKLLMLPKKSHLISKLSGGQKRRVSLACAMINNPKLLVLDEPTVGVDPMLRKAIWNLMVGLTRNEETTILITTHYIDEAKNATVVGMMRNGRILRESSPSQLMREFNCPSLEKCFIEICKIDNRNLEMSKEGATISKSFALDLKKSQPSNSNNAYQEETVKLRPARYEGLARNKTLGYVDNSDNLERPSPSKDFFIKIHSLFWRNLILLKRNWLLLVFQLAMPGMQVSLVCIFVGGSLFDLPIAVVNDESPKLISNLFIENLDHSTLIQNNFDDPSAAIKSVENGENFAVLYIPRNFTQCLFKKLQLGLEVDNSTISCSSIKSHMDYTNFLISTTISSSFFKSYEKFLKESLYLVGSTENSARPVVDFTETVYGNLDTSFTTYILPNSIMVLAFNMAILLTSLTFIIEKKNGIFDRFLITGVSMAQILVSHLFVQSLIILIQTVGFITIPILVFGFKIQGSVILLALLTFLQGLIGMTFGLLVSSVTTREDTAINIMNSVLYPLIFLSGYIWPTEALPNALKTFSKLLSLTIPTEAFRSIFSRGWGLEHSSVVLGFVVSFAWILIHVVLIVIAHKFKK